MSDLIWTPIKIRLGQIIPWQDNPRMSTKAQAQRLIKSERELGQIQTLAVSPFTDDNRVFLYDGHQRCSAWLTVKGNDYEVTALQSNRMLTDDERRKVSILLHTATGSWSWDALSSWSAADLREWGMDKETLSGWSNDVTNLKELLNSENAEKVDAEPQIDRAAELAEKWGTETGQLWRLGEHRLLIGDFRDARLSGDALFFDPPWDLEIDFDFTGFKNVLAFSDGQRARDVINRFGAPAWIFVWNTVTNWYTPNRPLKGHKNCFWYGDIEGYNWEGSFYGDALEPKTVSNTRGTYNYTPNPMGKHLSDCFVRGITEDHDGHSHGKPLDWVRMLIANCTDGDIVDPFCGTGTSIIAAQQLRRRCFASEIDITQAAIILERAHLFGIKDIIRDEP